MTVVLVLGKVPQRMIVSVTKFALMVFLKLCVSISPLAGDIGAVFGIGFPPFLGGPFRMLDQQGTQQFVDKMYRWRDAKGPQFEPAQILVDYAKAGKKFHN